MNEKPGTQGHSRPVQVHWEPAASEFPSGLHCDPNDPNCITCSDAAQAAKVVQLDSITGLALVTVGDTLLEVDTSLVDEVAPGSLILIHGGVAIGLAEEVGSG